MNSFSLCLSGCVCYSLHVWRIILLDTENSTVFSFSTLTMTTCYLLVSIISKDNLIVVFFYMMSHFTADAFKTLSLMTYMIVITFDYDTCRCDFFFLVYPLTFVEFIAGIYWWIFLNQVWEKFSSYLKKIILCLSPMVSQNSEALLVLHILLSFCSLDSFYHFISVCWVFLCTTQIYPWAPLMNFSFQFYFSTPEFLFGSLLYRQTSEKSQVRFQAITVKQISQ